ncbi:hypothetical protein HPULCUR_001835 [Helicostylum pulchrum]|uniref:Uncharacterized protein n=1 Tax=Helicostylum pulchrum TaxID=562976 RepID=A0ABP9XQM0_9FUNG
MATYIDLMIREAIQLKLTTTANHVIPAANDVVTAARPIISSGRTRINRIMDSLCDHA